MSITIYSYWDTLTCNSIKTHPGTGRGSRMDRPSGHRRSRIWHFGHPMVRGPIPHSQPTPGASNPVSLRFRKSGCAGRGASSGLLVHDSEHELFVFILNVEEQVRNEFPEGGACRTVRSNGSLPGCCGFGHRSHNGVADRFLRSNTVARNHSAYVSCRRCSVLLVQVNSTTGALTQLAETPQVQGTSPRAWRWLPRRSSLRANSRANTISISV